MQNSFRKSLTNENPLQVVGVIHAYAALLAEQAGFLALYLSGASIANCLGLPDLGMTTLTEVADEIRKITARTDLPLLVDGDTGFGSHLTIARMVSLFSRAGASAVHIEDQTFPKRCGHRPGKKVVDTKEMNDRLKAALDARHDENFLIVARTDAIESEGVENALERALSYQEQGADMLFIEAVKTLEDYLRFSKALTVPIIANITEFGKTPLFKLEQLKEAGVSVVLYPLSAFRAMNKASVEVYQTIRQTGSQAAVVDKMETRDELYRTLNYYEYEDKL